MCQVEQKFSKVPLESNPGGEDGHPEKPFFIINILIKTKESSEKLPDFERYLRESDASN
jgi:hypothetical protein